MIAKFPIPAVYWFMIDLSQYEAPLPPQEYSRITKDESGVSFRVGKDESGSFIRIVKTD